MKGKIEGACLFKKILSLIIVDYSLKNIFSKSKFLFVFFIIDKQ